MVFILDAKLSQKHRETKKKGFRKPVVWMKLRQGGSTSGHVESEQINLSQMSNTNQQGNCPVRLEDMVISSKCGRPGDSGSAIISEDGYLVGICTFGSTASGGTSGNCKAYNPSMWRCPSILGCTVQSGEGDEPSSTTPQQQQAQQKRSKKGYGDYYSYISRYNFPTLA